MFLDPTNVGDMKIVEVMRKAVKKELNRLAKCDCKYEAIGQKPSTVIKGYIEETRACSKCKHEIKVTICP